MKRKKLLRKIADWLDREGQKQRDHHEELETLLEKLKKKEAELEEKMGQEKDERKRKRLSKEIEIVRAQHAKGLMVLRGLE